MSRIRRLIQEIHRRSLWQVLGIYALSSWMIWEVVVSLYEGIGLPEWVPPTALVLLLIGLPMVLATAFVQEGGPTLGAREGPAEAQDDDAPAPAPGPVPSASRSLFTWSRAVTGGVLAFALLGLATTGFMGMRALGIGPAGTLIAKGELTSNARVLIADFAAPPQDSSAALAVTEALRIDLPQSSVIRVVEQGEVGPALGRMGLPPTARLTEAVAREVAVREGIEAVLIGELRSLGTTFQLTARLLTPDSGAVLLRAREVADGPEQLVDAVDRLSERIRERAGESLRSIRASEPLARATTTSLDALQLYSRAQRAAVLEGDHDRAAELLGQALALDTAFAMGWRKLGAVLVNAGRPRAARIEAFSQALRYADRLPPAERYNAMAAYYLYVEYEPERTIDAYREMIDLGVATWGTYNNLGLTYYAIGEFEKAAEMADRAVELEPTAIALQNQIVYHVSAGDLRGAERALARRMELYPDHPSNPAYAVRLVYYRGQRDSVGVMAERSLATLPEADHTGPLYALAEMARLEGRLGEADAREERANRIRRREGDLPDVLSSHLRRAFHSLFVLLQPDRAREILDEGLAAVPLTSIPPLDRPYLSVAELLALLGDVDGARNLLEEREREVPPEYRQGADERARYTTEGLIALVEGREEEALERLRSATRRTSALPQTLGGLAWAYDRAGRADSAIAAYHRYEGLQHYGRMYNDDLWLPIVYERLAQLHEDRGDRADAALYYSRLADLWKDADPELQPRVEGAQRALTRLTEERPGG